MNATPPYIDGIAGARAVLIASTGGHLAQLHRLLPHLQLSEDPLWITFKSEQSLSLLADARVEWIPYIAPRDMRAVLRGTRLVSQRLRDEDFDVLVSTGAAAALTGLPQAFLGKKRFTYIESVSRFAGPSLTGRIMATTRVADLYTQHQAWSSSRWKYRFSVLDDFRLEDAPPPGSERLRIFVTLGTIRPYRFDRLVDRLTAELPSAHFIWQLGETVRDNLPGELHTYMSATEFDAAIARADAVVTHAGVGTALKLLDMGVRPVLVPRRKSCGEHVDDHQVQIASHLADRGLAVRAEAHELTSEDVLRAATKRIVRLG